MTYPRRQTFHGSKQPSVASQKAQLLALITNARSLDALPTITALASMYRMPAKDVEYALTIERQRRERVAG